MIDWLVVYVQAVEAYFTANTHSRELQSYSRFDKND